MILMVEFFTNAQEEDLHLYNGGRVQFMNAQGKCMCVGHMYEDFVRPLLPSVIMSHFIDTHIVQLGDL